MIEVEFSIKPLHPLFVAETTGIDAGCPLGEATSGGETEFAELRAAWDALPETTKAQVEGLVAMHDIAYSRSQIGFTELLFGERDVLPPVPQPVVRLHPGSRRKALYLASHASQ